MPYISRVVSGTLPHLNVFGNDYPTPDGTGVRDFVHVVDVAEGHIAAIKKPLKGFHAFNLGTGEGASVLELVAAYVKASGVKIPIVFCDRRPGDLAKYVAVVEKANKDLEWKSRFSLEDMCRDSYNWTKNNPSGYK